MALYEHVIHIGGGFYNIRAHFKVALGMIDIGTHMSLCKLSNGNFLVIDTVNLEPNQKAEFDRLTKNGRLIEAVVATHPFHSRSFRQFHAMYPNAPYYATPRHRRTIPDIPWAGDVTCAGVRQQWAPEVEMRIPAGAEFVDPMPEKSNHFSNVFVFHRASHTIHNDDTVMCARDPSFLLRMLGFKHGTMMFHPSISGPGLHPTAESPWQFKQWLEDLMRDWDFDNICSAHNGCKIGGAKEQLRQTLERAQPKLQKISDAHAKGNRADNKGAWSDKEEDGVECG